MKDRVKAVQSGTNTAEEVELFGLKQDVKLKVEEVTPAVKKANARPPAITGISSLP